MKKKQKEPEPDLISTRLCARVRELRRKSGWTLEQLSSACGVSRSMLSQIERNRANPTLGVAHRIAQAFGLSVGDMLDMPRRESIDVIRANERKYYFHSDKDYQIRTLSPLDLEKDVEFYELVLHPGKALRSAAHYEGTHEFLTVQQGAVRIIAGNENSILQRGDSAHYPADVPHAIENAGRGDAVAFLVDIYRHE
jgi:transcriptional regulator with XRE-family HTH domain